MSVVRDQIEKAVRVGVLDVLEADGRPLAMTALCRRVDAAADIDDVATALRRLLADRLVAERDGRYALPSTDGTPAERARDAGPQRIARKPVDAVEAVLSAENDWLTIAEIQARVAGLTVEQIRGALKGKRFSGRACARGGVASKAYGLAEWPVQAEPKALPRSRIERAIDALGTAARWLTADELAEALDVPVRGLRTTLKNGVYNGRLAARYSEAPRTKRYGLPAWPRTQAEAVTPPVPEAPRADATAPRYGLFSDGGLSLEAAAGVVELDPAETRALVAYLIRQRAEIEHIFDTGLAALPS